MKGVKIKMKKLALQVSPMGEVTELDISKDSLRTLQTAVDGLIQPVDFYDFTMWVNEEGLLRNDLQRNLVALGFYPTPIMGTIVFTGLSDEEGETLGLSENNSNSIRAIAKRVQEMVALEVA